MSLQDLAAAPLPLVGQQALATIATPDVHDILATNPNTSPSVIDTLLDSPNLSAVRVAYQRTKDSARLQTVLETIGYPLAEPRHLDRAKCNGALSNPNTPSEILAERCHIENRREHPWAHWLYALYLNPTTPETVRRELTQTLLDGIIWINSEQTDADCSIPTAYEMVLNNPWLMEEPRKWGVSIEVAISGSPVATLQTLQAIVSPPATYGQHRLQINRHPLTAGINIHTLTAAELLQTETIASDILAISKPEFTWNDAIEMISRGDIVEAHIYGRLINRFGITLLAYSQWSRQTTERVKEAALIAPAVRAWYAGYRHTHEAIVEACTILGDSSENWGAFVSLLADWHDTIPQAAKTACKI